MDKVMLAPFAKVIETTEGGRELWGFATLERKDKSNEIADFDGTLEAFKVWSSEIEKNTQGKSKGNLRVMHQPVTGGTIIDWQPGETTIVEDGNEKTVKGIWVGSYVPPHKSDVIADIDSGILSAYSIGGSYAKKWLDPEAGAVRFIPKMSELSLVDNPAVPGAEFQLVKADIGPWTAREGGEKVEPLANENEVIKRSEESVTAEQLAKAAQAAGISVEQMTTLFSELAKAETPAVTTVDGDGDKDNNNEFPNPDENATPEGEAESGEKQNEEGIKKDDMEEAAQDKGVAKADNGEEETDPLFKSFVEAINSFLGEGELAKAGAAISEQNREKLHKAASHIHETCSCDKCMKAASIYAGKDGTNNGEEVQEPPVTKALVSDLQKAVGFSFAEELQKAGFVKQDDLQKFQTEMSEVAKSVLAVSTTLEAVNKSVESVDKRVEEFAKSANERLKAIEEAPVSGGPLLYGATGDDPVLGKGATAHASEYEVLNKAFESTTDPTIKDVLGRKLAILERKNSR